MTNPRILIVTLFNAQNFGAFLQAYAMQEVLKSLGLTPFFLDFYPSKPFIRRIRSSFTGLGSGYASFRFQQKKKSIFNQAVSTLNVVKVSSSSDYSAAFFGSDEIWNVVNPGFKTHKELFGIDVPVRKKFAYASCIGESSISDISSIPGYVKSLISFNSLSVRDLVSFNVISRLTSREHINVCVDPTFLHDFNFIDTLRSPRFPYLLVYTYSMQDDRVKEVQEYARRHDLKLISAGFRHMWCDYQLACTPFEFLTLIKNAVAVITDTFHGSVFSIKYNKDFIVYSKNKPKVSYLLEDLGLASSLVETGYLSSVDKIRTNFTGVDPLLQTKIRSSRLYLESCIAQIN